MELMSWKRVKTNKTGPFVKKKKLCCLVVSKKKREKSEEHTSNYGWIGKKLGAKRLNSDGHYWMVPFHKLVNIQECHCWFLYYLYIGKNTTHIFYSNSIYLLVVAKGKECVKITSCLASITNYDILVGKVVCLYRYKMRASWLLSLSDSDFINSFNSTKIVVKS